MRVKISGQIVDTNTYYSKKAERDVYTIFLFSGGRDVSEVQNVPKAIYDSKIGTMVNDLPINVIPSNRGGLYAFYDTKVD